MLSMGGDMFKDAVVMLRAHHNTRSMELTYAIGLQECQTALILCRVLRHEASILCVYSTLWQVFSSHLPFRLAQHQVRQELQLDSAAESHKVPSHKAICHTVLSLPIAHLSEQLLLDLKLILCTWRLGLAMA